MRRVKLREFQAKGSDGKTYKINAFRDELEPGDAFDIGTPNDDPNSWLYFTDKGQAKRIAKGSYKLIDHDFTFTSIDPNAP